MSVYFNQTNITPGTPFSGGGGSNFPEGLTISKLGANSNYLHIGNAFFGTQTLQVSNTSDTDAQPLLASEFIGFDWTPGSNNTVKTGNYGATTIVYQGNAGTGTGATFLSVADAQIATGNPFSITGLSTIKAGAASPTLNMAAFLSTMATVYPAIVGT
jgi:hypothetical protein